MSIVRSTTVALTAALAIGASLVSGVSANADSRYGARHISKVAKAAKARQAPATSRMTIASGQTEAGVGWQYYDNPTPGLYLDVDTSDAGFKTTPTYTASVGGRQFMFQLTGTSAIYMPTSTGFRVYVRWADNAPIEVADAVKYGWYVSWIGVD
ncbi:hypothetical protein AB0L05_02910 [Nonomuraea pusilla]|uniref:hypothetical protein n=1 Tax=Nonomuraea pusilla TaxID=46177 RepID=UPI00332507E1